jgi:hypothetical protein
MIDLDILLILDRSGSMQDRKTDHEGGVRAFVNDQRSLGGDARFTLVQFDTNDPCEVVYDRVPIAEVGDIHLIPRGGTPLLDAVGKAMAHLRAAQVAAPSQTTLVMIVTDGEENASTEWDKPRVRALLAELAHAGGTALFLGADIDAFHEAGTLGVAMANALNVHATPESIAAAYAITSNKVMTGRAIQASGGSFAAVQANYSYTMSERQAVIDPQGVLLDDQDEEA